MIGFSFAFWAERVRSHIKVRVSSYRPTKSATRRCQKQELRQQAGKFARQTTFES